SPERRITSTEAKNRCASTAAPPWLFSHHHSLYAWSALAAQTTRVELVSLVTCPTIRYHPAIVAQKAATVAVMSGGRFRLGVGAGENLNELLRGEVLPLHDARIFTCRRSRRRSTWPSAATRPLRSRRGPATGWSRRSRAPS